jgi:NADPH2:quinone reductase
MRAAWCDRFGDASAVTVREVPPPVPTPGQALIRVRAAAVNFPDVLMVGGRYQVRTEPPFIPGTELAGEVVESPPGSPAPGSRVTATIRHGAFAEFTAVDVGDLRPLPDGLDFVAGAAFRVTYSTAYHALVTVGRAQAGHVVAVLGAAGGVGLATVDMAHRLGLGVIAAASSPERLELCRAHGADKTIDYSTEPLKERLKELAPRGVDVVIDPVGGEFAEAALRAIAWGGRFVTVGYASGIIPRIPLNLVLLKGAQIVGFEMRGLGARIPDALDACEATLARLVAEGLRPHVDRTFALDDVRSALDWVANRKVLGKVVIVAA